MIPCQRHLFDLPDDIAYLNCAYMAPLMHSVVEAGQRGYGARRAIGRARIRHPPGSDPRALHVAEQPAVVADGDAPLLVVIGDVERVVVHRGAAGRDHPLIVRIPAIADHPAGRQ